MRQGGHVKEKKINPQVEAFIKKLKELGEDLSKLDDRDIFHPEEGYASKLVRQLKLTSVQLRRFYMEIRNIYEKYSQKQWDEKQEEAKLKYHLYKLYAMNSYQLNRGVFEDESFSELVKAILDCLDKNFNKESLRKATDFFMAMIAYSKK